MEMGPCSMPMATSIEDNGSMGKKKAVVFRFIRIREYSMTENG